MQAPPRRWRTLAQATRPQKAGPHTIAFVRRPADAAVASAAVPVLGTVGLKPGSYRLVVTARNAAGARRIVRNFVVLPPRG